MFVKQLNNAFLLQLLQYREIAKAKKRVFYFEQQPKI